MSIYPGAVEAEILVGGERVSYVDSKTARDPLAPLLLIHGSGGSARKHFGTLFPMFANGRRVLALDYGDPEAAGDTPLTLEFLAEKAAAVLESAEVSEPVDVIGYSLGAAVGIQLATSVPDKVRTLTLIGGWLQTDQHQRLRNSIWRGLFETDSTELSAFSILNAYGAPYLSRRTAAEVDALSRQGEPGPDRDRQMSLNADLDLVEIATRVTAPTLVIAATYDQIAPIHHSRQILGAIPDARLAQVNAGHAVLTERPAEIFQLIDEFTRTPGTHLAGSTIRSIIV